MNSALRSAALLAALALTAVALASPDRPRRSSPAEVRRLLEASYARVSAAFQQKKIRPIADMLTRDYRVRQPGGHVMDRQQILDSFKMQMDSLRDVQWPRTISRLSLEGNDKATVVVDGRLSGKMAGRDGKDHDFLLTATARDTWVKLAGVWRLKATEVLKANATVDGKPAGR